MNVVIGVDAWNSEVVVWFRGTGLRAAMLVVGGIVFARLVRFIFKRVGDRIDARRRHLGLYQAERAKYRRSAIQAITWLVSVVIYTAVAFLVLDEVGLLAQGTLVVIGSIAGTAIGFGARPFVSDVFSGFFIVSESHYGVGDIIRVADVGETEGVTGTVEAVTLRSTQMRTVEGDAVTIPNGEIRQVSNLSKGFSRILIDVPLAPEQNIKEAEFVIGRVLEQLYRSETWRPLLHDAPTIRGIDTLDVGRVVIQIIAETLPAKQFDVGREIRRRISVGFHGAGIKLATPIAAPSNE